jgi:pyruvate formate lyase activating enzyme
MRDPADTTAEMLMAAVAAGHAAGLRHVYAGNRPGEVGDLENTRCAECRAMLVERHGYLIRRYRLTDEGRCPDCAAAVPGRWSAAFAGQTTSRPFVPGRFNLLRM